MEFIIILALIVMSVYTYLQYKNYQKIQAELTSFAMSLDRTGNNLLQFNGQVENNLRQACKTLEEINISYAELRGMMTTISRMKTDEIGEYEQRKRIIGQAADTIDRTLTDTVNALTANMQLQLSYTKKTAGVVDDTMQEIIEKIREHTETQLNEFTRAVVTQKEQLLKKLEEETILADELRNLTEIKKGITVFETSIQEQNRKFDDFCAAIGQYIETQSGKKSEKSFFSKLIGD